MTTPDTPGIAEAENSALRARVAELESALAARTKSEKYYRSIVERLPSLLYIFDIAEQRTVYTNRAMSALLGYSDDENNGRGASQALIHPDDAGLVEEQHAWLNSSQDGEAVSYEYRLRHKSGEWRWFASHEVVFSRNEDGTARLKLGVMQDITEHRRADEELHRYKAVVEHAPDGIGVSNIEGIQVYANPAFQAMLGYGPDLIGMPYGVYVVEDGTQAQVMEQLFTNGYWQGITGYRRKDGSTLEAHSTLFLIPGPDGKPQGMGGVIRDITEQRNAQAERAALQEQVIRAQQAALHELSTPLIPLAEGLVAMPLIGSIDSRRAQLVIEALLAGVNEHRATTAILDITGVPVVDTQVAGALLRAAQAVKLLGAQVILTGIRPEIAQTLVGLGLDLSGIVTRGSLQSGIAYALGR